MNSLDIIIMCKHFYLQIAFYCWLLLITTATAQARTASPIDAIVFDEMARQDIVGMAVGIIIDGRLYYANGYGYEDLAAMKPVTTKTIFRWASVSKALTAAAVLKLAEENPDFSLNDRVIEHVGYWPRYGNKGDIRIGHLLSHRSGIIHYRTQDGCFYNSCPDYSLNRYTSWYYNARQSVDIFKDQALCFDPGTSFMYSTFGYSLLGAAIEGASGKSYAAWINDNIRKPLGMSSLRQGTGRQTGFDKIRGHIIPVSDGNVAWKLPGGGWESNIVDLAKFASALMQGRLLHNTARLWATVPGNKMYGYGMMHDHNNSRVWHEGSHINNHALLYLFPRSDTQLGIVVLSNSAHSELTDIIYRLANLLLR
jgi:CubicO group peptidase (beta-lactamase class C family)